MPSANFVAYVDESGDEGFQFGAGSSDWFVLAAAIFRRDSELAQVKLVDEVRTAINANRQGNKHMPSTKPLHFRDLKHDARKFYSAKIGAARVRTIAICVHKPSLTNRALRESPKLYFYTTRLLVERLGRFCYGADRSNPALDLYFSNRASMNYDALRTYLDMLHNNRAAYDFGGRPGVFAPERIYSLTPGKRMGLQIADAVASSYFFALNRNPFGQVELAYYQAMESRAYREKGKLWGNGIKLVPREAEQMQENGSLFV